MDDMIIKSSEEKLHEIHLTSVFNRVWQYNMRINLYRCPFGLNLTILLDST